MRHEEVMIPTAEGECPAHLLAPDSGGPHPAVIYYMDAFGIRPALIEMADRLVRRGYAVLIPDLFYRFGPYGPLDVKDAYARGHRAIVAPMRSTIDNTKAERDTGAILDYLQARPDIDPKSFAFAGFCMGGAFAVIAAGVFPERVAVAASYHGGNLATDDPASPHRLAPRMKGEVYVAAAENDSVYPPEMAELFERTLTEAGVRHRCELYEGAKHGWMMPDSPAFNASAAERGWRALEALLERNLERPRASASGAL